MFYNQVYKPSVRRPAIIIAASSNFRILEDGLYSIVAIGGGGAGGRLAASNPMASGGGGGGCAIKCIFLKKDQTLTITIGAGGTQGTNDGNPGGTTSVVGPNVNISATGGGGGLTGNAGIDIYGGGGGFGIGGDINYNGGIGGTSNASGASGGGGSGTPLGNGGNGSLCNFWIGTLYASGGGCVGDSYYDNFNGTSASGNNLTFNGLTVDLGQGSLDGVTRNSNFCVESFFEPLNCLTGGGGLGSGSVSGTSGGPGAGGGACVVNSGTKTGGRGGLCGGGGGCGSTSYAATGGGGGLGGGGGGGALSGPGKSVTAGAGGDGLVVIERLA